MLVLGHMARHAPLAFTAVVIALLVPLVISDRWRLPVLFGVISAADVILYPLVRLSVSAPVSSARAILTVGYVAGIMLLALIPSITANDESRMPLRGHRLIILLCGLSFLGVGAAGWCPLMWELMNLGAVSHSISKLLLLPVLLYYGVSTVYGWIVLTRWVSGRTSFSMNEAGPAVRRGRVRELRL